MARGEAMQAGDRIEKIVIVGGGTAGWMAAAALADHFRNTALSITLVESSEIGTVGVGEATIPTIRRFYGQLGMSDAEVLAATAGTCKLGICFEDWAGPGSAFIHPFGLFGQEVRGIGFHHYWLKLRGMGDAAPLQDYSLGAALAKAERFTTPSPNPPSQLSVFDWALHLDASLFAAHMRAHAERFGCVRIDGRIEGVDLRDDGNIAAVRLADGRTVGGELFIDCSGFRSLLLGEAMGVPYEDWGDLLLCDSAFAVQSESGEDLPSYTKVSARAAGWQWRIPLQQRNGNGIVFSSRHVPDEEALRTLTGNICEPLLGEPRRLSFRPGRRQVAWKGNCIGLGLAAGFLEPLESTSIALIETGIERLKMLFPDRGFDASIIEEYNETTAREVERVRDFLILHYALNRREEPFWKACRDVALPAALRYKMELFKVRGHFVRYRWEMFSPASWLAIYAGFGFLPDRYDPGVDSLDADQLRASLGAMRRSIADTVEDTYAHRAFIDWVMRRQAQGQRTPPLELAAGERR